MSQYLSGPAPAKPAELGVFFKPRGGCNEDSAGSNCLQMTYGWQDAHGGLHGETLLVGLGAHPVRRGPDGLRQQAPDILDLLSPQSPQKLRAIFLSHGHGDEDEAVVRYLEHGLQLPLLIGDELTLNIQKEKLRGRVHRSAWPAMMVIRPGDAMQLGPFTLETVQMGHTLPGSGLLARAGGTSAFFTGDFKLDQTTLTPCTNLNRLARMGTEREVDVLFVDSTRATCERDLLPEASIRANLHEIARRHPHQRLNVVVETGNAEALARTGWLAAQEKRVLVHHGSSIAQRLYAMAKSGLELTTLAGSANLIATSGGTELAGKLSPSYVLNVMAGINGEKTSVFSRVCRGSYEAFRAGPEDVFILSAGVRPWNALKLDENIRLLKERGVEHVYRDGPNLPQLDESGHEQAPGLRRLYELVKPQAAIAGAVGGRRQREACSRLFNSIGDAPQALTLDNGSVLQVRCGQAQITGQHPSPLVSIPVRPDTSRQQAHARQKLAA